MESLTKPIALTEISYPVFRLGTDKPIFENGVVLYITHIKDLDTNKDVITYSIVDDTNVEGKSLAVRRLRLQSRGVKLKRINRAVFFLGDLIKIATSKTWFIDATGNVFRYTKSTRVVLEYRKINKVIPIKSGGAILELANIPVRFKSLYAPKSTEQYAGVLKYGLSYILYGVSEEKYDSTWRLI